MFFDLSTSVHSIIDTTAYHCVLITEERETYSDNAVGNLRVVHREVTEPSVEHTASVASHRSRKCRVVHEYVATIGVDRSACVNGETQTTCEKARALSWAMR